VYLKARLLEDDTHFQSLNSEYHIPGISDSSVKTCNILSKSRKNAKHCDIKTVITVSFRGPDFPVQAQF
jgi:hypothetical protein